MPKFSAAEDADILKKNSMLLNAAREGNIQVIQDLVSLFFFMCENTLF